MPEEFYPNNELVNFNLDGAQEYEIVDTNRELVMGALRSSGVGLVRINFSGGGDDGQIDENIDFQGLTNDPKSIEVRKIRATRKHTYLEDGKWVEVAAGEVIPHAGTLHAMLMEFADDIVGGSFPYDWCNNEGGSGTIEIRPGDERNDGRLGSITVLYTQRIETTEDHTLVC